MALHNILYMRRRRARRRRRPRAEPLGLLRTERYELHALNLTARGWDAWWQSAQHSAPPGCGLPNASHLIAALVWASPARSAVEAQCGALSARATVLARRPRLLARPRPTLVDGSGFVDGLGGATGPPRLLVVDPLVSGGVDQLSAIPTHAKRLALAAAAMGAELEAVQWRTKAARQGSLASRVTRSYLAKYYSKAYVIGGEGASVPALRVCNGLEAQGSDLLWRRLVGKCPLPCPRTAPRRPPRAT